MFSFAAASFYTIREAFPEKSVGRKQAHGSGGSGASVGAGRTVTVIVSVPRW